MQAILTPTTALELITGMSEDFAEMCVLCQAKQGQSFVQFGASSGAGHLQYGAGSVSTAGSSGAANTDALISGYKWAGTALKFAMPATGTAFPGYNAAFDETGSFAAVTGALATAVRTAIAHISDYTGLNITETSNISSANLLIGRTGQASTAYAYLPDGFFKGGDVWFGTSTDYDAPARGNYAYTIALHEIGHALGLKHGHTFIGGVDIFEDDVGITNHPVAANRDSLEFSVMTYRSHIGQDLAVFDYYTNEDSSFPQTLMMFDIAALQQMYGADFTTNATSSVYTFDATNGQMSVNGVSDGALAGNRIFRTVWDGGGNDTYDFSNFSANQTIDLTPGSWSLISVAQRADLGSGNFARGNVFNALQFGGDLRSLIENANGGSGNDIMTGNQTGNYLVGNGGSDSLSGLEGADSLDGGTGSDTLSGGEGDDLIFYDAADIFANVTGGNGTDILNVVGGNAPTSLNLAAQGFERAYHQLTDTTNQAWSSIRDIYGANWARIQSNIFMDDNTRQDRNFDHATNQPYSEYIDFYLDVAFASTVTRQVIFEDPGTKQERFFDYRANQAYSEYINFYLDTAFPSLVTRQVIFEDPGTKQERFLDYRTNQAYSEYINFYTDLALPSAVTRQVIFEDPGTKQERFFDHNNTQAAYREYINYYTDLARPNFVTRQVGFNDAGGVAWEYFF